MHWPGRGLGLAWQVPSGERGRDEASTSLRSGSAAAFAGFRFPPEVIVVAVRWVPALWAVVPRRRGAARRTRRRRRPRHRVPLGAALHAAAHRRGSALPSRGRGSVVRGRDPCQGRRGVALRVPGGRPVRSSTSSSPRVATWWRRGASSSGRSASMATRLRLSRTWRRRCAERSMSSCRVSATTRSVIERTGSSAITDG